MNTLLLRAFVTSCMLFIFAKATFAQSACPNANFSAQNFSSWEGSYGSYTFPNLNSGFVAGRHTILTAPALDPLTCGGLNVIPPGETCSARLGNQGTGAQAERLRYGMTVAPDNALFIYKYAVVLENPDDHAPDEQPEFSVRVLDANGMPIGGNCGTYTVYGGQPGQNFQTCGTVTWLPWATVGIDLTPFMGQQIFIEFTTKDCRLGAHFGYAYICAGCSPLTLQMDYCAGDQQISMSAPAGFQQYTWMPGNLTGQSITVPTPAIGTVFTCTMTTFSNQGNCSVDVTVTVQPTEVTAHFPSGSACVQNALLFLDSTTVTNNGTITGWQWNFGDGGTSNVQFPTHAYATGGQYTATLIATSANGCQDTTSQPITVYQLPQVEFTSTGICSNDTVHFTNQSTDVFPLTYEWDFGDNSTETIPSPSHLYAVANNYPVSLKATSSVGCENIMVHITAIFAPPVVDAGPDIQACMQSNVTLTGTGAQTYSWTNGVQNGVQFLAAAGNYTVTGTDANGCIDDDQVIIGLLPLPVVDAGPDEVICLNQSVALNAVGAITYVWDNGTPNGGTVSPGVGSTVFHVTGTDANGCSNTDQLTVLVNPLPIVDAGTDHTICYDGEITLDATGAITYAWSNNLANGTTFNPTVAGNYVVVGTDANGCSNSDSMVVAFFPTPVIDAGPDIQVCVLTEISMNVTGAQTYIWSSGIQNNTPFFPNAGQYTVIGTDINGCRAYDTVAVSFFPVPQVNAGPDQELCATTSTTLQATGSVNYSWNSGIQNGDILTPGIGNNLYTVVGTDANGCSDTDQVAILVHPLPIVNAGTDQVICQNAQVTLLATGAQTYTWTNGVMNGQPFTPTIASFYTVTGTDVHGCTDTDSVLIAFEIPPSLNMNFSVNEGCAPLEVDMANASGTANNCMWSFSDGTSAVGCDATHLFETAGCWDVTLTSTSPIGCVYDTTLSQAICVFPTPHAAFQPTVYGMLETDPTTAFNNSSIGAVAYDWDFGDGTGSNQESPIHTYSEDIATYEVILTATSDHGCVDTAIATVWVEEDLIYYVPNTFTPDGDGHNEDFKPVIESGFDPNSYHFYIYNRWGQQVFESEDINEGWDGTFNGFTAQDGTYTWKIEFKSTVRRRVDNVVTGHVNILK